MPMNTSRLVVLAALVPFTFVLPVSAYGAAFGAAQVLDLPVTGSLAAAVGPGGEGVVAGVRAGAPAKEQVEVATRAGAGAAWKVAALGPGAGEARDVQVAIGHHGVVVAWGEVRGTRQAVVVATGDAGGVLTVRRRVPVADAFAAFPRLTRLPGGAVVLAWRDGKSRVRSRVRVATIDGDRFASEPRTVGTNAAQVALAVRGARAAVGWTSTYHSRAGGTRGPARPRTLTVRALDARGLPTGPATTAGRDVGPTVRLAGAPDGRLVASWVRPQQIRPYPGEDRGDPPPPSAYVAPVAFTRQLLPQARPARPVGGSDQVAGGPPTVAFDGADHAVAALRTSSPGLGPAFDVVAAGSRAGWSWSSTHLVAHLGFSRFDPVAVAPASGDVVIVHTSLVAGVNTPNWTVGATDSAGTHLLGTTTGSDGRGVVVARAPARLLVAWSSGGHVQIAERT